MKNNISFGNEGEQIAEKHLINNGYKILHKNWRFGKKEIDIVCKKDEEIIFVEVKTRTSDYFEDPKEAVTRKKQKHIIEAANAYIEKYNIQLEARFDIVSIVLTSKNPEIEHIEDAFNTVI